MHIILGLLDNTGIKCARFKGTSKDIFLDKKEFDEDLFSNLHNTIMFLQNHLNLIPKITELKRTEDLEIPIVILREALLNAIIHRDYTRNSDIKVAVYDDIVEIVSPGGLPNGLTEEDVFSGRSELRNKVVARVFKELGYVETWGTGIQRIARICDEQDIKFEFRDDGNFVSIVFYRTEINKQKEKNADEYGRMRTNTDECGRIRTNTNDCRLLRTIMDDCQKKKRKCFYIF